MPPRSSSGVDGEGSGISSRPSDTVVVDEPSWIGLDPGRRTLVDIDEPTDVERATRR